MGVFSAACLALALGAGPDPGGPTGPGRPRPGGELGAEDARYLDWIVKDFLFDPRGAVRVRVRVSVPATGLKNFTMDQDGWLVRGANGPVRLHLADGEAIPVPATGVREL